MWAEIIQPGTKIYVCGKYSSLRYVSRVEDIYQGVVFIDIPFLALAGSRELMQLNKGDSLVVFIPGRQGLYRFNSLVLIPPEGSGGRAGISFPDQVSKTEMRSYARVDKRLKVQFSLMPLGEDPPDLKKAEAVNISAGGMRLSLPQFIEPGSEIKLQFVLPAGGSYSRIKVSSQVAWTMLSETEQAVVAGVKFYSINRRQQEVIQQYVLRAIWLSMV